MQPSGPTREQMMTIKKNEAGAPVQGGIGHRPERLLQSLY